MLPNLSGLTPNRACVPCGTREEQLELYKELLEGAGFPADEIEAKLVAAVSNERPRNPITEKMDSMRAACATIIAENHDRLSESVRITEMSLGNNFDIVYGDGQRHIRVVTERGDVAIMDVESGIVHELPGGEDVATLAAYILEYLVGGEDAMRERIDNDLNADDDNTH
jgi:hypothetical protein